MAVTVDAGSLLLRGGRPVLDAAAQELEGQVGAQVAEDEPNDGQPFLTNRYLVLVVVDGAHCFPCEV